MQRLSHRAFATPAAAYQQACFAILPGEGNYSLHIQDRGPFKVGGWFLWLDEDGRRFGDAVYYCHESHGRVPEGAKTMYVVVWGFQWECGNGATFYGFTTAGRPAVTLW